MSASNELQALIYQRLMASSAVQALVNGQVSDTQQPLDERAFPNVTFGPSDAREDDADCITGRIETVQIDCWSRQGGKKEVKSIADAVKESLHLYAGDLGVNALVELRWLTTRIFDDPDGKTYHAAVTFEAMVEEH